MEERALIINGGSSSIKFAGYLLNSNIERLFSGTAKYMPDRPDELEDEISRHAQDFQPDLIVHRIVHGGPLYSDPIVLTAKVLNYLKSIVPMAAEHMPSELKMIQIFREGYPHIPQAACFDTAFHRSLPDITRQYPLSKKLRDLGILRYGFHGLSFEYLLFKLRALYPHLSKGKLIFAHLGNGASMVAVNNGSSIDTTMGFTPAGGLMMGTRPGDLDPGIILYLLKEKKISLNEMQEEINHQSGLKGLSEQTSDAAELFKNFYIDPKASTAIRHFCYQAKKYIGMLAASLGGLDGLVFTGGIGENISLIRSLICSDLGFLGINLHEPSNDANEQDISGWAQLVKVLVIKTNEEEMMAIHARELLRRIPKKYSYGN